MGSDFQVRLNTSCVTIDLCKAGGIPHEEHCLLKTTILSTKFMCQKIPGGGRTDQLILLVEPAGSLGCDLQTLQKLAGWLFCKIIFSYIVYMRSYLQRRRRWISTGGLPYSLAEKDSNSSSCLMPLGNVIQLPPSTTSTIPET